ncbi:DUF4180 domain-containing protein [Mucilaginibacter sp. BT774]|uniref:DUF4180 domain-containing protein n=1 Tax=Mucilaginibacter sp. BT774 TaxID=3062276 RepID=UPI002676F1BE|nr:DUF4180 domain-containing protein [Mucilaginibacter sp. BT774]
MFWERHKSIFATLANMQIISHQKNGVQIAEVLSDSVLIKSPEDGAQLLNDLYYQGFDGIIIKADQLSPDFFELKTGLAGEVLQKFSNRRVRLAIIGDFNDIESKSLRDFVFESNKGNLIKFTPSVDEALSGF